MFKFPENETLGCEKIIETIEVELGWMLKLCSTIRNAKTVSMTI